jgi:flavin reductase (DIM6/NTAB) family NADH-FMN oxidoreductase RutF
MSGDEKAGTPAPDQITPEGSDWDFKSAMALFATGVTIVTTHERGLVHGSTVQAFCSLSLSPRLVLVALSKDGRTMKYLTKSRSFAVNVLNEEGEELARRFADPTKTSEERFRGLDYRLGSTGNPLLNSALATVDCVVEKVVDAGDHVVVIGRVVDATANGIALGEARPPRVWPLIYFDRNYARIERRQS